MAAGHGLGAAHRWSLRGALRRGNERLGEEGLLDLARAHAGLPGPEFIDALIEEASSRARAHGGLTDDIAVVRVERSPR